jgi:hypothetical protein
MLTISNANYFGGSFHIAPRAKLDDGQLDLVAIHDAAPAARARLFNAVSKGKHEGLREVEFMTGPSFSIHFDGTLRFEADGEVYSSGSPLVVTSVPAALRVCTPRGRGGSRKPYFDGDPALSATCRGRDIPAGAPVPAAALSPQANPSFAPLGACGRVSAVSVE